MKYLSLSITKWLTAFIALPVILTGCVVAPPQSITIVEGITLDEPLNLPACSNLEIQISEGQQVDIKGLENIEQLCVYRDPENKWQIKGLEMTLVTYPLDKKPNFVAENFMLALLGQENRLMRIQIDTSGANVQEETLIKLTELLGPPSILQVAPKENFWGAVEGTTLAAWNNDFVEAMYIGEIEATKLGSISLTSKNIYKHTVDDQTEATPAEKTENIAPETSNTVQIPQEPEEKTKPKKEVQPKDEPKAEKINNVNKTQATKPNTQIQN